MEYVLSAGVASGVVGLTHYLTPYSAAKYVRYIGPVAGVSAGWALHLYIERRRSPRNQEFLDPATAESQRLQEQLWQQIRRDELRLSWMRFVDGFKRFVGCGSSLPPSSAAERANLDALSRRMNQTTREGLAWARNNPPINEETDGPADAYAQGGEGWRELAAIQDAANAQLAKHLIAGALLLSIVAVTTYFTGRYSLYR